MAENSVAKAEEENSNGSSTVLKKSAENRGNDPASEEKIGDRSDRQETVMEQAKEDPSSHVQERVCKPTQSISPEPY